MKNDLKKRIMKRVYAIWFFKKVAPVVFLYMPFLVFVALREVSREFFVIRIIDNFLTSIHSAGITGAMNFISSALSITPVLPSLVIVSSLILFVYVFRRLFRNFKQVKLVGGF